MTVRRWIVAASTVVLALSGATGLSASAAPDATAAECWHEARPGACISDWGSWGQPCGTYYCLYYSPGLWNASWRPASTSDGDLSGNKFYDSGSFGSAGVGQVVRNNAAAMGNNTSNCRVAAFKYTSHTGNYEYLWAGYAGDLMNDLIGQNYYFDGLRNDEASIRTYSCS
ncbi:hypothetical protein GWI34_05565 [Actinomadura sp. DSM 109109]|nr:hypothetical protein [Actinomadura lepetitiana]